MEYMVGLGLRFKICLGEQNTSFFSYCLHILNFKTDLGF